MRVSSKSRMPRRKVLTYVAWGRLQGTLDEERVLDGLPQLVHRNKGKVSVLSNEL